MYLQMVKKLFLYVFSRYFNVTLCLLRRFTPLNDWLGGVVLWLAEGERVALCDSLRLR